MPGCVARKLGQVYRPEIDHGVLPLSVAFLDQRLLVHNIHVLILRAMSRCAAARAAALNSSVATGCARHIRPSMEMWPPRAPSTWDAGVMLTCRSRWSKYTSQWI